jgi:hypothetical protein
MDSYDSASSEELLRRARTGDASALGRLLGKNRAWLVCLARRWFPRS